MDLSEILMSLLGDDLASKIIETVAVLIGLANLLTVWLPNTANNKVFQFVLDALNWLSMNIGKNKNNKKDG